MGHRLPDQLRTLLGVSNGAVIFHDGAPEDTGLHVISVGGEYTLAQRNAVLKPPSGLLYWASTPGTGGHLLAVNLVTGEVLDAFGRREPWPVIAPSIVELFLEMERHSDQPLFWI